MTILTERDRQLVEAGYLPIDVDPPRKISARERETFSDDRREHIARLEAAGFEARVGRGAMFYVRVSQ
jgi:hypothetical protein